MSKAWTHEYVMPSNVQVPVKQVLHASSTQVPVSMYHEDTTYTLATYGAEQSVTASDIGSQIQIKQAQQE